MDCELKGLYSYKEAKILSTGTLKEKDGYSGEEHPIVFAVVGSGMPIGIINMWPSEVDLVRGFRDVWEYGAEEPEIQTIKFLNKEEASKIKDFIVLEQEKTNMKLKDMIELLIRDLSFSYLTEVIIV